MGEAFLMNQKGGLDIKGAINSNYQAGAIIKKGQMLTFDDYSTVIRQLGNTPLSVSDFLYPEVAEYYTSTATVGLGILAMSNDDLYYHQVYCYGDRLDYYGSTLITTKDEIVGESTNSASHCIWGIAFLGLTNSINYFALLYGKGTSDNYFDLYVRKIGVSNSGNHAITLYDEVKIDARQYRTNKYGGIAALSSSRIAVVMNGTVYVYDIATDGSLTLVTSAANFTSLSDAQISRQSSTVLVSVSRASPKIHISTSKLSGTTLTNRSSSIDLSSFSMVNFANRGALKFVPYDYANADYVYVFCVGGLTNGRIHLKSFEVDSNGIISLIDNDEEYGAGTTESSYIQMDVDVPKKYLYVYYTGSDQSYPLKQFTFDIESHIFTFNHGLNPKPDTGSKYRSVMRLINTYNMLLIDGNITTDGFVINRLGHKRMKPFSYTNNNANIAVALSSASSGNTVKAVRPYENIFPDPKLNDSSKWIAQDASYGAVTVENGVLSYEVLKNTSSRYAYYAPELNLSRGEIFYLRFKAKGEGSLTGAYVRMGTSTIISNLALTTEWQTFSVRTRIDVLHQYNPINRTICFGMGTNSSVGDIISVSDIEIYSLSDLFGYDNEPSVTWCNENI